MKQALKPIKRRIRLIRFLQGLHAGVLAWLASCFVITAVSFFVPIERIWLYLLLGGAFVLLFGLAGLLWPVTTAYAARKADASGLKERTVTALALQNEDTPMVRLQREDAVTRLKELPVKQAMPVALRKQVWISIASLAVVTGILLIVPNPQHDVLRAREQVRQVLRSQADEVEKAAETLADENLTEEEQLELRRITSEMARELRNADDKREALEKLAEKQQDMEKLEKRIQQRSAADLAAALGNQSGLKGLSTALENGGEDELSEALEQLAEEMQNADSLQDLSEQLAQAAQAMPMGSAQQALMSAAAAAAAGSASQSLQMLAGAISATTGGASGAGQGANLSALMSMARNGVAMAGSSQSNIAIAASGAGGAGSGNAPGGGAGTGTTNRDAGYKEGLSSSGGQSGRNSPVDRLGDYERIYDPTRLGDGGEISHVQGQKNEGESQQIDLGPGVGDLSGSVPYNQVIGEYSQAAAQAMRRTALPEALQDWVQRYFNALIE